MLANDEAAILDLPRDRQLPTIGAKMLVQVRRPAQGSKLAKVSDRVRLQAEPEGLEIFWAAGATRLHAETTDSERAVDRANSGNTTQLSPRADALVAAANAVSKPELLLREHDCLSDLLWRFPKGVTATIRCDSRTAAERWNGSRPSDAAVAPVQVRFEPEREWEFRRAEIVDALRNALEPQLDLPGGGTLLIEPGETLTAIDVNAQGRSHPSGEEKLAFQINQTAVAEIVRIIRLINVSGNIVVDFMSMRSAGHRRLIADKLRAAVEPDPAAPWVGGMSPLGLVEIGRRHLGPDLFDLLSGSCDRCAGRGLEIDSLEGLTVAP
jgi:Rne/Rng family ribonuclease